MEREEEGGTVMVSETPNADQQWRGIERNRDEKQRLVWQTAHKRGAERQ